MESLSFETLREKYPVIFTQEASPHLSKHYVHIPTSKVVEDMAELGWLPVDVKMVKARKRKGFQKHLIKFQHPDIKIDIEGEGTSFIQILLTNSHDGKSKFHFDAGIFRLVCSNGLVIKSSDFGSFSIRHMGYSFNELSEQIDTFVKGINHIYTKIDTMNKRELTEEEQNELAIKAYQVRMGQEQKPSKQIIKDLLEIQRVEDGGSTLWASFNRIQEKLIHGDFTYVNESGKIRKARKIKNFQQQVEVNQGLWEVAEVYC